MSTFDVTPERLTVFEIDGDYLFVKYFERQDVFEDLQEYYDDDAYRFEIPEAEFDTVRDLLEDAHFDPVVVTDLEPYCVVIDKYDEHAEILKRSVANWERSGHRFFLMKTASRSRKPSSEGLPGSARPTSSSDCNDPGASDDQITPHLEVPFARDEFDRASLENATTARIDDGTNPTGPAGTAGRLQALPRGTERHRGCGPLLRALRGKS